MTRMVRTLGAETGLPVDTAPTPAQAKRLQSAFARRAQATAAAGKASIVARAEAAAESDAARALMRQEVRRQRRLDARGGGILKMAPPPPGQEPPRAPPVFEDQPDPLPVPPDGKWTPFSWQREVLAIDESSNLGLFGGRGRGATSVALMLVLRAAEKYPESNHLFTRNHLRSLHEVEESLTQMLTASYGLKNLRINRSEHHFRLPNGSVIEMSPLADANDGNKLLGRSYDSISADEYGNYSAHQMQMLDSLRANLRGNSGCPKRFVLLGNPAGRGHVAVVNRFINKCEAWHPTKLEDGTTWTLAPATFKSNPYLPKSYAVDLFAAAGRDAELYRGWAQGDWAIAKGAVLADVIDQSKQMFAPENVGFDVQDQNVRMFLACDWGTAAPSVCYLAARLKAPLGRRPRGSLLLLDETHSADPRDLSVGLGFSPGRLAEDINAMCDRWKVKNRSGCIDDARGLSPDETLIKTMARYALHFTRPAKGRAENLAAMRELLWNSKEGNQRPGLWISSACPGWWETVPVLPRDPRRSDLPDSAANDHFYDASAYAVSFNTREITFGRTVGM